MKNLRTEPAVIVSLVSAIVALAAAFGLNWSAEQVGAVMAVVVIVAGLVTRQQVTPAANVDAAVNEAVANVYREIEAG